MKRHAARLRRFFLLTSFLTLLAPCSLNAFEEHDFRFWNSSDGLGETMTFFVAQGLNDEIIVSSGSVPHFCVLDGYNVKKFPAPHIHPYIQQDSDGNYWSDLTNKNEHFLGLQRFNITTNQWEKFPIPFFEELINSQNLDIQVNGMGYLSFAQYKVIDPDNVIIPYFDKVYAFHPSNMVLETILSATQTTLAEESIKSDNAMPIFSSKSNIGNAYIAKDGGIWIEYINGAIKGHYQKTKSGLEWNWTEYPLPENANYKYPFHFIERDDGVLFAGISNRRTRKTGIAILTGDKWEIRESTAQLSNVVFRWLDTNNRLCLSYDVESVTVEHEALPFETLDITFENDNSIFMASNRGLAHYSPSLWSTPDSIPFFGDMPTKILEDEDKSLWFLSFNQLVHYKNGESEIFPLEQGMQAMSSFTNGIDILPENKVAASILNASSSIQIFDPIKKTFTPLIHPENRSFYSLQYNEGAGAWIHSIQDDNDYLEYYDGSSFKEILDLNPFMESLEYSNIRSLVQRSNGDIWLGHARQYGPVVYKNNIYHKCFNDPEEFPGTGCFYLLDIGKNKIWSGGRDEICEYDGKKWRVVKTGFGTIRSMIKDSQNRIWVASENGVHCYDTDKHKSWVHYTSRDGLPSDLCWKMFEDSRGDIWVGTEKGVSRFNPSADAAPPKVWMAKGKNSSSISPDGNAQFVFDGIDKWKQTRKERLQYSYRIDDQEWSEYTTDTVAALDNIEPGNHIFQVRAMDLNWNISGTPAIHKFQVMLPWYQEPKVIMMMGIGSILILLFAGYALNRHIHLQHSNRQLNNMNVELQEVNAQLVQLDQMKTQFVSQASHDLRTPLTAIKGSLDNLLMGIAGALNEKQQKVMIRATTSVDRLTNLINDVLDLNRIETGRIVLEKSDIPFKALVENIINENRPAAEQKQITLNANLGDEITLYIDGSKIERVVGELISNAIKYTPNDGTVDVGLSHKYNTIELSVKDSGIGMTAEECGKIWERFYRTSASQKFAKGSGLGLSIAKELVELHDGMIELSSEPGSGTTFTLRFPAKGE